MERLLSCYFLFQPWSDDLPACRIAIRLDQAIKRVKSVRCETHHQLSVEPLSGRTASVPNDWEQELL